MNKLFTVMGRKFKFHVQDSDLAYLFGIFDKHIALSEKKLPLARPSPSGWAKQDLEVLGVES